MEIDFVERVFTTTDWINNFRISNFKGTPSGRCENTPSQRYGVENIGKNWSALVAISENFIHLRS